jgi:hypothetical protein
MKFKVSMTASMIASNPQEDLPHFIKRVISLVGKTPIEVNYSGTILKVKKTDTIDTLTTQYWKKRKF